MLKIFQLPETDNIAKKLNQQLAKDLKTIVATGNKGEKKAQARKVWFCNLIVHDKCLLIIGMKCTELQAK